MHEIRNFSAPDFVLAGKTIDIRAGPPNPPPLDNHRVLSGLCQMPGKVFSTFSAPDDEILTMFLTHIEILSVTRLRKQLRSPSHPDKVTCLVIASTTLDCAVSNSTDTSDPNHRATCTQKRPCPWAPRTCVIAVLTQTTLRCAGRGSIV